jgi:ABC-type antimicrobial peptide transport system ATPase subunit
MVIARRGMNFSERLPSSSIRIPDGRGGHVTLDASVVNTKHRHVWSSWAKMTKVINEALAAQSQPKTKRKQVGDKPTCGLADDWIPEFSHVGAEQGRLLGLAGEIPALRPDLPIDGRIPTSQNVRINTTQTKNLTQPGRF